MIRHRGWVLGAAVLAALVAGMPADALAKKKVKKSFVAKVNGKKLKVKPNYVQLSAGGGTIGFSAYGVKIPPGGRGIGKIVSVSCATLWPPPALGTPLLACLGGYTETNSRNPTGTKYWLQFTVDDSTTVIIDSWDGVNVAGHFTSTVPPGPGNSSPPVSMEGSFKGPVQIGDPNR